MAPKRKVTTKDSPVTKKLNTNENLIPTELEIKCINSIRVLAADTVEKAKSGHPGAPMGCAPMAHLLWKEFMRYSPQYPDWSNRDRFVLSNGHACALLYSMLHLTGYDVTLDDLKQFRQLMSKTPGHPECFATPGVEVCTGPLGQGICNAVGMAMAERHLASVFNKEGFPIVDHFTYVICGDGCLQEGISSEASSLAGHLKLGKLIVLYDDNHITIDGETELSFTEDVVKRYDAYGWHTQIVDDANNLNAMRDAILAAQSDDRPSIIKIRTVIGHGSLAQGTEKVHGTPLGAADLQQVKRLFGFNPDECFAVADDVRAVYHKSNDDRDHWEVMMEEYTQQFPDLAADFRRRLRRELPAGWKDQLPRFPVEQETAAIATRSHSEKVLNAIANVVPDFAGGSADLTPSNLTALKCTTDFQPENPSGRYFHFGVREHGMAAICNGMFAHGGIRPFCATFLNFISYALGAVRLSALSRFGVTYVMTHDSIGLGEDGPTHQPIETLETLRAMPNMLVFRPGDGNETTGSYICALENPQSPSVLALSRQAAPALVGTSPEKVAFGGYVVQEFGNTPPSLIIASTGTELSLSVKVAKKLAEEGISSRVVSMVCWRLFDQQPLEYQLSVFPDGVPVFSMEASTPHGWQKYAHSAYGINGFGLSAPGGKVYEHFGLTVDNLVKCSKEVIGFYAGKQVLSLVGSPRFHVGAVHH